MSQNLQNFAKFQEFQIDNLVDFEKCCKTRIYLQKSVPIQPKTSNILPKFCRTRCGEPDPLGAGSTLPLQRYRERNRVGLASRCEGRAGPLRPRRTAGLRWARLVRGLGSAKLAKFANFCKFLAGSFSAVSKRIFARKYAFDSIFQDLQDLHTFAPLQSQNFRKKSVWKISNFRENSAIFFCKCCKCCKILPIFKNFS